MPRSAQPARRCAAHDLENRGSGARAQSSRISVEESRAPRTTPEVTFAGVDSVTEEAAPSTPPRYFPLSSPPSYLPSFSFLFRLFFSPPNSLCDFRAELVTTGGEGKILRYDAISTYPGDGNVVFFFHHPPPAGRSPPSFRREQRDSRDTSPEGARGRPLSRRCTFNKKSR